MWMMPNAFCWFTAYVCWAFSYVSDAEIQEVTESEVVPILVRLLSIGDLKVFLIFVHTLGIGHSNCKTISITDILVSAIQLIWGLRHKTLFASLKCPVARFELVSWVTIAAALST